MSSRCASILESDSEVSDSDRPVSTRVQKRPRHEIETSGSDVEYVTDQEQEKVEKASGKSTRAKADAAKYHCQFKPEWTTVWPFIKKGTTPSTFWCDICRSQVSCSHQGKADVARHVASTSHERAAKAVQSSGTLDCFAVHVTCSSGMGAVESKTRRAEVKMACAMAVHNIPLAFADHFSPLLRDMVPDSEIARGYQSAKTKTTCIITGTLKEHYQKDLVAKLKKLPFSISIDGSNDTSLEKMNPMTVNLFDVNSVSHLFLDMCTTTGYGAATAETIFGKMDQVLNSHSIAWKNCVAFSVDNASVNMGIRNSIRSRVLVVSKHVFVHGCPCHILHNTAGKASTALAQASGFDVEDLAVDVTYWFDKSTKRKAGLEEFCIFCDTTFKNVISHVFKRRLSLEKAVDRILELYDPLASYFRSTGASEARFKRLEKKFSDPHTQVYLLFFQAAIPLFTTLNRLLQRQDPALHLLASQQTLFIRNLLGRFVMP